MTTGSRTDRFVSAAASGSDWREVARKVLAALEEGRAGRDGFTLGFLYITDHLSEDAESLITLFRSVTGIQDWVGTVGLGVCGCGGEFIDQPAMSAMICQFDKDSYRLIPVYGGEEDSAALRDSLSGWLRTHQPMLAVIHADPMTEDDPAETLASVRELSGAFLVGGLSAARKRHVQFAGGMVSGGVSGVVFSDAVPVAASLSQGCAPAGPVRTVTSCEDHIIRELDGRPALTAMVEDIKSITGVPAAGESRPEVIFAGSDQEADDVVSEDIPEFRGEIHAAFPVPGADVQDYMVRNLAGLDPQKGWLAIAQEVQTGDRLMFVHRDDQTVCSDLRRMLSTLKERVERERGSFAPRGALYVSCAARALSDFGGTRCGELAMVREVIGDVPLVGFYAGGEILNGRLYGYTGILTLFL